MNLVIGKDITHLVVALDSNEFVELINLETMNGSLGCVEIVLNGATLSYMSNIFPNYKFVIGDYVRVIENQIPKLYKHPEVKCKHLTVDWLKIYRKYRVIRGIKTLDGMVIIEPVYYDDNCEVYLGYPIGEDFSQESIYDEFEAHAMIKLCKLASGKYNITQSCESLDGQIDFILKYIKYEVL